MDLGRTGGSFDLQLGDPWGLPVLSHLLKSLCSPQQVTSRSARTGAFGWGGEQLQSEKACSTPLRRINLYFPCRKTVGGHNL